MSGLALVAAALGASVTGSDPTESSYTARLREHGIEPLISHAAANVPAGAELIYSTAVPPENPEPLAASGAELHRGDQPAHTATVHRCLPRTSTHGQTA